MEQVHFGGQLPGRPSPSAPRPFSLLRGRLCSELTEFLSGDPVVRLLVNTPRDECHPDARHRGHKAVTYHAVGSTDGQWPHTHVDLTGFDHDGLHPPAGPRLYAFAAAFRHLNRRVLQELETNLRDAGQLKAEASDDMQPLQASTHLPDFQERVFGSCTVQHFVAAHSTRPDGLVLDYHVDSGASALHLAISLGGVRRLRLRRVSDASSSDGGSQTVEEELLMRPGDVYLSSPSAFAHAVHRGDGREGKPSPKNSDAKTHTRETDVRQETEALAIQFRIAVPGTSMSTFENKPDLFRLIAATLGDYDTEGMLFRLPCLDEVLLRLPRHVSYAGA